MMGGLGFKRKILAVAWKTHLRGEKEAGGWQAVAEGGASRARGQKPRARPGAPGGWRGLVVGGA